MHWNLKIRGCRRRMKISHCRRKVKKKIYIYIYKTNSIKNLNQKYLKNSTENRHRYSCIYIRCRMKEKTTQRAFAMPSATIITIISIAQCLFRQAVSPRRRNKKSTYRDNLWCGTESKISRDLHTIERSWRYNDNWKKFLIFLPFSTRMTIALVSTCIGAN